MCPAKVLITGASGFVGRHLTEHLEAAGDEVVGIDRVPEGIDITDADQIRQVIADVAPRAIYHLAGWADVGGSWKAPVDAFFEKILVNADDPKIRENRLRLLSEIRAATQTVADFSKISG